jgi:rubrerythrin
MKFDDIDYLHGSFDELVQSIKARQTSQSKAPIVNHTRSLERQTTQALGELLKEIERLKRQLAVKGTLWKCQHANCGLVFESSEDRCPNCY